MFPCTTLLLAPGPVMSSASANRLRSAACNPPMALLRESKIRRPLAMLPARFIPSGSSPK